MARKPTLSQQLATANAIIGELRQERMELRAQAQEYRKALSPFAQAWRDYIADDEAHPTDEHASTPWLEWVAANFDDESSAACYEHAADVLGGK